MISSSVPENCDYDGLWDNCSKEPEVIVEYRTKPCYFYYCRDHGREKLYEIDDAVCMEYL